MGCGASTVAAQPISTMLRDDASSCGRVCTEPGPLRQRARMVSKQVRIMLKEKLFDDPCTEDGDLCIDFGETDRIRVGEWIGTLPATPRSCEGSFVTATDSLYSPVSHQSGSSRSNPFDARVGYQSDTSRNSDGLSSEGDSYATPTSSQSSQRLGSPTSSIRRACNGTKMGGVTFLELFRHDKQIMKAGPPPRGVFYPADDRWGDEMASAACPTPSPPSPVAPPSRHMRDVCGEYTRPLPVKAPSPPTASRSSRGSRGSRAVDATLINVSPVATALAPAPPPPRNTSVAC